MRKTAKLKLDERPLFDANQLIVDRDTCSPMSDTGMWYNIIIHRVVLIKWYKDIKLKDKMKVIKTRFQTLEVSFFVYLLQVSVLIQL